jgi:hypothetical protein
MYFGIGSPKLVNQVFLILAIYCKKGMEEKDVQLLICFVFKLAVLAEQGPASECKALEISVFKTIKSFSKMPKTRKFASLRKRLRELQ